MNWPISMRTTKACDPLMTRWRFACEAMCLRGRVVRMKRRGRYDDDKTCGRVGVGRLAARAWLFLAPHCPSGAGAAQRLLPSAGCCNKQVACDARTWANPVLYQQRTISAGSSKAEHELSEAFIRALDGIVMHLTAHGNDSMPLPSSARSFHPDYIVHTLL